MSLNFIFPILCFERNVLSAGYQRLKYVVVYFEKGNKELGIVRFFVSLN